MTNYKLKTFIVMVVMDNNINPLKNEFPEVSINEKKRSSLGIEK